MMKFIHSFYVLLTPSLPPFWLSLPGTFGSFWFALHIAGIGRDRGSLWPHCPGPIRAPAVLFRGA